MAAGGALAAPTLAPPGGAAAIPKHPPDRPHGTEGWTEDGSEKIQESSGLEEPR